MEGLPVTCFELFCWDGREAACNRRVCRKWRANIERVARLVRLMAWHFVHVPTSEGLKDEFRGNYREIQPMTMTTGIESTIMTRHGINMQRLHTDGRIWPGPEFVAERFGWQGEGVRYLRDTASGDLLIINNFYDGSPPDAIPIANYQTPIEQAYEGLTWLERVAFPGTFTWKFIHFPAGDRYSAPVTKHVKFHRGSCFYLRFRFRGDWSARIKTSTLRSKRALKQPPNEAEKRFASEYKRRSSNKRPEGVWL